MWKNIKKTPVADIFFFELKACHVSVWRHLYGSLATLQFQQWNYACPYTNTHSHLHTLIYLSSKTVSVKIFIAQFFPTFYGFGKISDNFLKQWPVVKIFVGNIFHHFYLLTKFTSSYHSVTDTCIYALILLQLYYSMTKFYNITSTALNTDGC